MNEKIYLKDIFGFNELLSQSDYKGYRIKLRFNKNWDDYSFVDDYISGSEDFLPMVQIKKVEIVEMKFSFNL